MVEQRKRQRIYAPRTRLGCLTCRGRRKRCDRGRPSCDACVRLNLECVWQEKRIIAPTSPSSPPLSGACAVVAPQLDEDPLERREMLTYYLHTFVPTISVATIPSSFFTTLYIPMAFSSAGVLDAVVATASSHFSKLTLDRDRAIKLCDLSAKYQARCHAFIRERIDPSGLPTKDHFEVIAMTLLLVGIEIQNGTRGMKWMRQLNSVRHVIASLRREGMDRWELDCIERHFTYHDIMASLMFPVASRETSLPLLGYGSPEMDSHVDDALSPSGTSSKHDSSVSAQLGLNTGVDPLMGISRTLFSLIRRVSYLQNPSLNPEFYELEREILQWKHHAPLTSPADDLSMSLDLTALAEAYKFSTLILLYHRADPVNPLLPSLASRVLGLIRRIPIGSTAEAGFTYPLFLAGAELETEAEIEECLLRLRSTRNRSRFENIRNAERVLEAVWTPWLNGGKKKDWADVLSEWKWTISLS